MDRLFRLIFKLAVSLLILFLLTAAWVVLDGIADQRSKADVGLVYCQSDPMQDESEKAVLDRVVTLFRDGDFPAIIVSGPGVSPDDTPAAMVKYLTSKGIPASVIVIDKAGTVQEGVNGAVTIMRADHFDSVMIVDKYYQLTRMKIILFHEGIAEIQKAHVGQLQMGDIWDIGQEVFAIYDYVGSMYILPTVEKIRQEFMVGADKAKVDADAAKDKVDKSLDTLPK
jgi:vancomycin permeability regulator SanA